MFQLPSVITNTIAATRIYRSLADYTFEFPDMYSFFDSFLLLRSLLSMALSVAHWTAVSKSDEPRR